MRERAGAATPGPWEHPLDLDITHGYHMKDGRHVADWIANADAGDGDIPEDQASANADHIASWHPLVAAAVADLLEREAAFIDAQVFPRSDPAMERYPLAVARAYLGETSETPA